MVTWFLAWPAYAISHGLNPFYSTASGYPHGVNLLSNASSPGFGVLLAPITWVFGPIATLNAALTLSPALSALAMFVLLRRWVRWMPAAFVGGLLYGFSPFILYGLTTAHLMTSMAAIPPLIVLCTDELLIRQQARSIMTGLVLGVLLVTQFFFGTELLLITVIFSAIGIALLVAYAYFRNPQVLRARLGYAGLGLGTAAVTSILLLGYPAWYALSGPAHLSGQVWLTHFSQKGFSLTAALNPTQSIAPLARYLEGISGYEGPVFNEGYFGLGVAAVLIGGCVVWRRDKRLWLFGAIGTLSVLVATAIGPLMVGVPEFENVVPNRIVIVTWFAASIMIAFIVDHTHLAGAEWSRAIRTDQRVTFPSWLFHWFGAIAGLSVAVIAIVPIAVNLAPAIPFTTQPEQLPPWFRDAAIHMRNHQVILVLPDSISFESPMEWQAVDGMKFSMVDNAGPGALLARAGVLRPGYTVIADTYSDPNLNITNEDVAAVRAALTRSGVTMVVNPEPSPSVESLITSTTGIRPIYSDDAWVWTLGSSLRRGLPGSNLSHRP